MLYWASVGSGYQDEILGSSPGFIYRWEIGNELPETPYFSLGKRPGKDETTFQVPYATMGYDDRTDEIVFATTHGASYNYRYEWIYRIDGTTGEIHDYQQLRPYFWFPAMPIFPDRYAPEFTALDNVKLGLNAEEINLYDHIRDLDGGENHIVFRLDENNDTESRASLKEDIVEATLVNGKLTLNPVADGECKLRLLAESNGKVAAHELLVTVGNATGIQNASCSYGLNYSDGMISAKGLEGCTANIYDINGRLIESQFISTDNWEFVPDYSKGLYILRINGTPYTLKFKL